MGLAKEPTYESTQKIYAYPPLWVNPIDGIITSLGGYRYSPITGYREFHDGVDIAAPVGTPIVAPRDGTVVTVRESATFGLTLRISHPDGYTSFMAHLDRIIVEEGDDVLQGEMVAYSGNTGRSTGPHLHYGIFLDGEFRDPIYYIDLPKSDRLMAP